MEAALELALQIHSVDALLKAPPKGVTLKRVDFSRVLLPECTDTRPYQILLHAKMAGRAPVRSELAVMFPNYAEQPLLWASQFRSLRDWNKALNHALSNSLDETDEAGDVKLCIAYGKHLYVCKGFSGRLYLFWAHVHCADSVMGKEMPVLINTDAKLQPKAVMVLHPCVTEPTQAERIPLTHASPVLRWNRKQMGGHPFVCEERRTVLATALMPVGQRERDAMYELTRSAAPVHTKPLLVHNPLNGRAQHDADDDDDSGVTVYVSGLSTVECEEENALQFTTPVVIVNE